MFADRPRTSPLARQRSIDCEDAINLLVVPRRPPLRAAFRKGCFMISDRRETAPSIAVDEVRDALRQEGFHIFRDVIPPEHIATMKQALKSHFARAGHAKYGGKYASRGMNISPDIARILSSEAVMNLLRRCTSPQGPVLTGECDLMANTTSRWHKDITDAMGLGDTIYEDPGFEVYKLAIYLQDQKAGTRDVLKLRPGSHHLAEGGDVPVIDAPVKAGDVIVFDVRIDHAGRFPKLHERVMQKGLAVLGRVSHRDPEPIFTALRKRMLRRDRLAVYLTFGPDAPCTYEYEAAGRRAHGPLPAALDGRALAAFTGAHISVIQPS